MTRDELANALTLLVLHAASSPGRSSTGDLHFDELQTMLGSITRAAQGARGSQERSRDPNFRGGFWCWQFVFQWRCSEHLWKILKNSGDKLRTTRKRVCRTIPFGGVAASCAEASMWSFLGMESLEDERDASWDWKKNSWQRVVLTKIDSVQGCVWMDCRGQV